MKVFVRPQKKFRPMFLFTSPENKKPEIFLFSVGIERDIYQDWVTISDKMIINVECVLVTTDKIQKPPPKL